MNDNSKVNDMMITLEYFDCYLEKAKQCTFMLARSVSTSSFIPPSLNSLLIVEIIYGLSSIPVRRSVAKLLRLVPHFPLA